MVAAIEGSIDWNRASTGVGANLGARRRNRRPPPAAILLG
jgi:hypothetical protein